MAATALPGMPAAGQAEGGDMLTLWAEATGRRRAAGHGPGGLRFAFYGRVSTEDWQDPVTSRARQRDQAAALVAGHGRIVAEFFDTGYSRTLPWARRPQAAALVAALADPDRGWDAIVIGEYERAFYGGVPRGARRAGTPRWWRAVAGTGWACSASGRWPCRQWRGAPAGRDKRSPGR